MSIRMVGALLCGAALVLAAQTGAFAASNNYNTSRSNTAGIAAKGGTGGEAKGTVKGKKPKEECREGRGICIGRDGGAFEPTKKKSDNK